ncbi:Rieske 2Fe-2S domain-containing protein [Paraburkholderia sp. J63]|uniref:Rieske 2Fe-2S domain-containing protein n=1 Tax=Paraburkholderia sp. J63 TaxID=2805434 RepID=UPI002ABE5A20|nr:Rieske 2Fe-2S domain-containing protein [Paraburkholderia sp. J63]
MANTVPDFARVENGALAGKFLKKFWQPIALSRDYDPGKARRIQVLGEHFTLYRGEDGEIRLTQDRCPHRGTSLAYGWVEGNSIRCRYHGWKFDGAGKGEDFPAETATYASRICLKTYPTREYLGMVFAYFGDETPPTFWKFPELEDESRGELLAQAVVLPYNHFQRIENDHDEVHAHYTHNFMPMFGLTELPKMSARETEYGMVSIATRSDGSRFDSHCFMPNILYREVPIPQDTTKMAIHFACRVPIDDVSMLSFMVNRVGSYDKEAERLASAEDYAELTRRVMNCEITLEDVDPAHPLLPIIQDTVSIGGQGAIVDREQENLGQSDVGIAMLRRIWAREMKAIAEGTPPKQWYRPEDFSFSVRALEVIQEVNGG